MGMEWLNPLPTLLLEIGRGQGKLILERNSPIAHLALPLRAGRGVGPCDHFPCLGSGDFSFHSVVCVLFWFVWDVEWKALVFSHIKRMDWAKFVFV